MRQRELDLKEVQACLRDLDSDSPDVVSRAMARYLTVRSARYIGALRDDLADLCASATGHQRLHRRVVHHLRVGLGTTPDQLPKFVGSFDPDWRITLEAVLDAYDQVRRNQLSAMVAARKKIAHSGGDQVTAGKALGCADIALEMGKELAKLLDPGARI